MYYKSRYHLSNGTISLALDSLTGEILELVHEKSGENLIKNHSYTLPQPLSISAGEDVLRPGDSLAVRKHPELKPEIRISQSGRSAEVCYGALWDGTRVRQVKASYTVELPEGTGDSVWRLSLLCGEGEELDGVCFPCLNGIYLGESWTDDTLVYPHISGIKVEDPVTTFEKGGWNICWRWQDYKYIYSVGTLAQKLPGGLYGMRDNYSGLLSMKWLDYYGDDFGLYFACHDPDYLTCSLYADTLGTSCPGMNFSVRYPLFMKAGDSWRSPDTVAALHEGDWHAGADKYRAFHRSFAPAGTAAPEWFKKSAGLVAHYDFKYQNGGVVHKFNEIGQLLEEAKEMGFTHLLFAGWHHDGFDNGFPMYFPEEELGTEDELREQIRTLREKGGHVCFYVNSRIGNWKYDELHDFYRENGVFLKDGTIMKELYGSDEEFVVHCIGSRGWREKLEKTVEYLTEDIGIDGMYLDQLVMGEPAPCINPEHDHRFGEWNSWYKKLLEKIGQNRQAHGGGVLSMIHEGCADSYGGVCSGQLISTFSYHHCGAFPAMYRYTFPEQMLVDMLYPGENLAMRPVHVAQASREIMDRAFILGMYYWVYDLRDDNTFTRAPESLRYLKDMVRLRKFWLDTFGQGDFRDTKDLVELPDGVKAVSYGLENGLLLACANTTGQEARLAVSCREIRAATAYTAEGPDASERPEQTDGKATVRIPAAPLSLIYLED